MDQNSEKFPFLSYVLYQSDPTSHAPPSLAVQQSLLTRFSLLTYPQVTSALTKSLPSSITQTIFLLRSLGPRPDPSVVSSARSKIAQIQQIGSESAAEELEMYTAVLRMEEVHQGYEKQLRDVEGELARVYASAVEVVTGGEVNEEVVAVLKQAENDVVERVDLSGRQLKHIPEAFGNIQGLVSLNLSHNELKFIPDAISGLKKLEELDVSSNILEFLPDSIGLLLSLRVVNVSGNKLNTLPESISNCRSLVELDASFNELTSLPANIGYGLLNLEKLSIHLNKIRLLPASICEMRSLRFLGAHMNEIHSLPLAIGRLTNLEILSLGSNFSDLTELPDTISDLINLRKLDLSNNQIRVLPDSIFRLEKLAKLNLDQNPLEIPPLEVATKGAEAVREFMRKRWQEIIAEEQQRTAAETNRPQGGGPTEWLAWGTSMVSNFIYGVTQAGGGHGDGRRTTRDSYLDQQL